LAHKPGSCAVADNDLNNVRELGLAYGQTSIEWKGQEAMVRILPLGFTCPELAQPAQSLELVREAVKSYAFPRFHALQLILGAALYANEQYEEAKAALLKALEPQAKPDPMALFFLAMTEWNLDRQADARSTYDRAVARMNDTWPKSPDLVLLKKEAGRLIGTR
jgi:tetratricopeptide (TPR) repeat protein